VKFNGNPTALAVPVLAFATLFAAPASAHSAGGSAAGFAAGFLHPLSGLDHLLAMVMAVGGALGVVGMPLPYGELLIALSVVVLGALVATARRVPVAVALIIVGVFAVAHGHAHGVELPVAAVALAFTVGFVLATGLLHLAGITIGVLTRWPGGSVAIRIGGCAVAVAGCYFVYGYAGA